MKKFTLTWEAEWSNRKIPMMVRDITVLVRQMEGARNVRLLADNEARDSKIPVRPQVLHLGCTQCAGYDTNYAGWYAPTYEACRTHGKEGVVKVKSGRVPLPENAHLGQQAA